MKTGKAAVDKYVKQWKSDRAFRAFAGASFSCAATAFFALYNGYLGLFRASVWHGMICAYYLVLTLLRGLILAAEANAAARGDGERLRRRICRIASLFLLALNGSLVVPISLLVLQRKPVTLTLIPAIAMAAYTFYKVTAASVRLARRKRAAGRLTALLRTIGFIDALVSLLTLQNTLIMVQTGGGDPGMLPLTAVSSFAVFLAVLLLSVSAVRREFRREP